MSHILCHMYYIYIIYHIYHTVLLIRKQKKSCYSKIKHLDNVMSVLPYVIHEHWHNIIQMYYNYIMIDI